MPLVYQVLYCIVLYVLYCTVLVYQAVSWQHGVFLGASVKSEATAAAEHKGKVTSYFLSTRTLINILHLLSVRELQSSNERGWGLFNRSRLSTSRGL